MVFLIKQKLFFVVMYLNEKNCFFWGLNFGSTA